MTDTLQITDAHRALAAYLRSRESEFGTMSDLAYEVISGVHRAAFAELIGHDRFGEFGPSNSQQWTNAYQTVLRLVPAPDVDWAPADEGEPHREAQAQALATMRQREADAIAAKEQAERYRDSAEQELNLLRVRVSELNDALNEQAEERDWCSEFEEFVEQFDDLLSVATTSVSVTIALELKRGVSPDEYAIADYLYDLDRSELVAVIQSVD